MAKLIPLTRGFSAQVDDNDFECINKYKWHLLSSGYASRTSSKLTGRKEILMHRFVAETPSGMETDHINGDKLDNRHSNLRISTHAQNAANRGKQSNNTSGHKGVTWYAKRSKWQAQITVGKKHKTIGYFKDPKDAARAYDEAARKYFGEFAGLNEV